MAILLVFCCRNSNIQLGVAGGFFDSGAIEIPFHIFLEKVFD
jgi:hypothetical protein